MLDPGLAVVFAVFEETISLGAIIVGIVVSVATIVGIVYGAKWKVTAEAALSLAAAREDALEDTRKEKVDLQEALAASKEANAQLRTSVEKLEQLPNLTRIVELMTENTRMTEEHRQAQFDAADRKNERRAEVAVEALREFVSDAIADHEAKAQERHDQQIAQGREIVSVLRKLTGRSAS